jgi:signal transduction histidine kinase
MFLLDEEKGEYKLEAVRLKSKYQYLEALNNDDALIQRLSTVDEPLVYEEIKIKAQELKDQSQDPLHEIASQMRRLQAAVVIPATSRGRLLGFLVLGEKNSKRMYSQDDLSVLWALSYQAALAIENARFHQKAQEELLREDREVTSRFIGHGASHQFGNLLHRIIQRSEGKQMDLEELDLNNLTLEDAKKLILELKGEFSAITKTAFQGKDIVSGILSLGSGSPVEFKEEDLRAIITTAVSTIKLKQSKKTIQDMASVTEIVTHIRDNLPKIYCNSMQLEQVLDNLLDNDLEAIEEKQNLIKCGELKEDNFRGRITIETTLENNRILIRLSDNGIGIRPEDQKKVFMPFFTTKATERLSRKGHGIGMHMVKEIIKAHQGKIYIDKTEYTKGTTFVMELPLKVSENKKV